MSFSFHLREADEHRLREAALHNPNLAHTPDPISFTPSHQRKVGIDEPLQPIAEGHIKLKFEDFVVEELTDGRVSDIAPTPLLHPGPPPMEGLKLECIAVKRGMSTFELTERLAEALGIELSRITYAGLKDGRALTAQRISLNSVSPEQVLSTSLPKVFLKNLHWRHGMRSTGELDGNRFRIIVRCPKVDETAFLGRIHRLTEEGFLNFFSLQRFGSRLISHELGHLLLRGETETAIRRFLCETNDHETRLMSSLRNRAAAVWKDWPAMKQIFEEYPYFCQNEVALLTALSEGQPFEQALEAIPTQTKMFISAFESYIFNRRLSQEARGASLPDSFTLPAPFPEVLDEYSPYLSPEEMSVLNWRQPYLRHLGTPKRRHVPTRLKATVYSVMELEVGLAFLFDLPKGAYATTFLASIFSLTQGYQAPEWIDRTPVDSGHIFGMASVQDTLAALPSTDTETDISLADLT